MSKNKNTGTWIAAGIVLLGLGLRLYELGSESLWIDEGFSLRDAMNFSMMGGTRPLYFAFLAVWIKLGTMHSEFLLRLPSALFGAAGVWVFYALGRRLLGTRVALLASVFMAVSVLQINHSREVRMYSLTVLLVLLATYFLVLALDRGKVGYYIGYALFALGSLLTQPLSILILMAHGLYLLLYIKAHRPRSLALIGVLLVIVAIWTPWLLNSMGASSEYSEGYTSILERPTPLGAVGMLGRFFLWKWSNPGRTLMLGALGFSFLVLAAGLYGMRGFRKSDNWLALTCLWLAVPLVGIIVMSYTVSNMWMVHYLISVSPAMYLLVSKGIMSIKNRYAAGMAVAAIFVLTFGRLGLYYAKNMHPEWERAVSYIEEREQQGDVIGVYYSGNKYVFDYYYQGKSRWAGLGEDEISSEHFSGWNDSRVKALLSGLPASGSRSWVVLSNHEYAGGAEIVGYLTRNYKVLDHRYYSQIEMFLLGDKNHQGLGGHTDAE